MTYMINAFSDAHFIVGGAPTFGMAGAGTFSEELIILEQAAMKIDADIPYDVASLLGCGVMTGVGAALNAAHVEPGSSVVVFGCGGVGISVIQGARIAGAATIVAVRRAEEMVHLSPFDLSYAGKNLRGTDSGSSNCRRASPRVLALCRAGRRDLDGMSTRRLSLDDINDAFGTLTSGDVIRQV